MSTTVQRPSFVTHVGQNQFDQHGYGCSCNKKNIVGIVVLIAAAALLIFAVILASGVFGGGKMALVAGGLTIASMVCFGVAAYLLVPGSSQKNA